MTITQPEHKCASQIILDIIQFRFIFVFGFSQEERIVIK